jgi:hypothetical protein
MTHLILYVFLLFSTLQADDCSGIIQHITEKLPCHGILKNANGFVYVDIDDGYIHELIKFIDQQGYEEPPYFGNGLVGAHITVMDQSEGVQEIQECGQVIEFIPLHCEIVQPLKLKGVAEAYLIVVESQELNSLREQYHLLARKHPYHITIGVKHFSEAVLPVAHRARL